jgi:2-iminobutanoate/2-iminopropanoate deaminase
LVVIGYLLFVKISFVFNVGIYKSSIFIVGAIQNPKSSLVSLLGGTHAEETSARFHPLFASGNPTGASRKIQTQFSACAMISDRTPSSIVTMGKQVIQTNLAPAPVGPYNQAIVATGKMLFVSGQIAIDPATNQLAHSGDVAKQTELVMANLAAILTAAGASFEDVVKTGVYLQDMNDFATVNAVYARFFDEATAPARACVEVARLPKDVLVEIDCIAVVP